MRSDKVARKENLPLTPDDGLHLRHWLETASELIAGRLPEGFNRWTCNQSERRGKFAGRRMTNDRRHRKGNPTSIAGRVGISGRRTYVRWVKPVTAEEENGNEHSVARRCKRRRHVKRVSSSNWGCPTRFIGMFPMISCGIRRKAEGRSEVEKGVGDGHSSKEGVGQHNPAERRAISLRMLLKESGGRA